MGLVWTETASHAEARIGRLGSLIVRQVQTDKRQGKTAHGDNGGDYSVVVFGTLLRERSRTIEHGKARALFAAQVWVMDAGRKLLKQSDQPDACPRFSATGNGCDFPTCDCGK